jgi:hypothetical protein
MSVATARAILMPCRYGYPSSTSSTPPRMIFISAHPPDDFADIVAESPAIGLIPKAELSSAAITDVLRSHGTASDDSNQRESK